jgi:hypothetical protein
MSAVIAAIEGPEGVRTRGSSVELEIIEHWVNPNRNSARVGTVSVRLRKFAHHDCSVTRTKRGFFVHLPSMPMVDRDGVVLKDEGGKWKYRPAVTAINKASANAFSDAVIEIIKGRCPEMLKITPAVPRSSRHWASSYARPHRAEGGLDVPDDPIADLWPPDTGLVP